MLLFTIAYGGNIALFSSVCFNKSGENQQKLKIFVKLILRFAQMVTQGHSLKEMTLLEILSYDEIVFVLINSCYHLNLVINYFDDSSP